MADYPTNGPGVKDVIDDSDLASRLESAREAAEEMKERAGEMISKAREAVIRNPAWSIAGAVAAGFLFARFVARRR
jgi:ElaB/YqjD/DUF883 family membrane-anchored ribosome-binding protein